MGNCFSQNIEKQTEFLLCNETDLENGEMKVVTIKDVGDVLVVKNEDNISALGTNCTHYGAPLVKGVLANGYIRCPWHGACFNAKTGDIEDFPGLDSLPCFKLRKNEGSIYVLATKEELQAKKVKKMVNVHTDQDRVYVIVGGGAAGQTCVETLRQNKYTGRIIMLTNEEYLPYDRPKLSKAMNSHYADIALREKDFYDRIGIEVHYRKEVISIDTVAKRLVCQDNTHFVYDKLMIATGGIPRSLTVSNARYVKNIYYLRNIKDANYIAQSSVDKNVAIVGLSFIAMEVAAFLVGKAKTVQIIGRGTFPFQAVFGDEIGYQFKELFEQNSVLFHTNTEVEMFNADLDENLVGIQLKNGKSIIAEVCVIGIGVKPATNFLKRANISLNSSGYVKVNKYLQTNDENIFAAGDIAYFPLKIANNNHVSIGHWQVASNHGRVAALNMIGKREEVNTVPFFWSVIFGKSIRYAGYCDKFEEVINEVEGTKADLAFVSYFIRHKRVVAIATFNKDPLAAKFASILHAGKKYHKSDIKRNPLSVINVTRFPVIKSHQIEVEEEMLELNKIFPQRSRSRSQSRSSSKSRSRPESRRGSISSIGNQSPSKGRSRSHSQDRMIYTGSMDRMDRARGRSRSGSKERTRSRSSSRSRSHRHSSSNGSHRSSSRERVIKVSTPAAVNDAYKERKKSRHKHRDRERQSRSSKKDYASSKKEGDRSDNEKVKKSRKESNNAIMTTEGMLNDKVLTPETTGQMLKSTSKKK